MPALEGGAALPVTTGGQGQTEARPAVPVYVVTDGPVTGQRARRVVVVTSGPVEGGAAIPVYDMGVGAVADGDAALPVFVVSGSLGGGGVAPFNPASLAPIWWLRGDDVAADPVATWPDASGNGHDATQGTGVNQPARILAGLNGHTIVRFDDTSDRLVIASITHNIGIGDFWYMAVLKTPASLVGYNCLLDNGSEFPSLYITDGKVNLYQGGDKLGATVLSTSTWYTVIAKRASLANAYRINGVDDANTPANNQNITNSTVTIGSETGGGTYWGNDIAEVMFGSGALSPSDQTSLEAYAKAKYAHY